MKYNMHISVRISEEPGHYGQMHLEQDSPVELRDIGEAGELLLRIHQLIRTVQDKRPKE
jgi:hypothetical protein